MKPLSLRLWVNHAQFNFTARINTIAVVNSLFGSLFVNRTCDIWMSNQSCNNWKSLLCFLKLGKARFSHLPVTWRKLPWRFTDMYKVVLLALLCSISTGHKSKFEKFMINKYCWKYSCEQLTWTLGKGMNRFPWNRSTRIVSSMRVIQTDFSVKFGPNLRCVGAQFKEKIRIHNDAHLHTSAFYRRVVCAWHCWKKLH